jgi:hypothetical protein
MSAGNASSPVPARSGASSPESLGRLFSSGSPLCPLFPHSLELREFYGQRSPEWKFTRNVDVNAPPPLRFCVAKVSRYLIVARFLYAQH